MQQINLDDYTLLSRRAYSANYIKKDGTLMIKTYPEITDDRIAAINHEAEMSAAVNALGIPTPGSFGLTEIIGGGVAAVFQNITNKKSISRAVSQDPENMEIYMEKFVKMARQIHKTIVPPEKREKLIDVAKSLKEAIIGLSDVYTKSEIARICDYIDSIPKSDTAVHGDFHPGNFITGDQGDFAIDIGDFGFGNEIFDWAHWYYMSHFVPEQGVNEVFHMSAEMIQKCFNYSVAKYFEITDPLALAEKIAEFEKLSYFYPALHVKVRTSVKDDLFEIKSQSFLGK